MDREVFSDPASANYINTTFVPVRVTDEDHSEAAAALRTHHEILGLPTLIVVPHQGKDPAAHPGVSRTPPDDRVLTGGRPGGPSLSGSLDTVPITASPPPAVGALSGLSLLRGH